MPEGQWEKCPNCGAINNQRELKASLRVCPKCGYHYRMNPEGYFALLLDEGSCQFQDRDITAKDPLGFTDRKK